MPMSKPTPPPTRPRVPEHPFEAIHGDARASLALAPRPQQLYSLNAIGLGDQPPHTVSVGDRQVAGDDEESVVVLLKPRRRLVEIRNTIYRRAVERDDRQDAAVCVRTGDEHTGSSGGVGAWS